MTKREMVYICERCGARISADEIRKTDFCNAHSGQVGDLIYTVRRRLPDATEGVWRPQARVLVLCPECWAKFDWWFRQFLKGGKSEK